MIVPWAYRVCARVGRGCMSWKRIRQVVVVSRKELLRDPSGFENHTRAVMGCRIQFARECLRAGSNPLQKPLLPLAERSQWHLGYLWSIHMDPNMEPFGYLWSVCMEPHMERSHGAFTWSLWATCGAFTMTATACHYMAHAVGLGRAQVCFTQHDT